MARSGYWISSRNISSFSSTQLAKSKSFHFSPKQTDISTNKASLKRNDLSLPTKRGQKTPRRLITISTSDGKWHGKWNYDYIFTLQELQLEDLAEDGNKKTDVSISLCIHKHTGFGLSVDGRISTSFTRKCINCSSPYCREINTSFNVWVLPSGRQTGTDNELPIIDGDDPSVIYVKPGYEADLDSLVQDTIRLATSVKETCSESCEKSEPKLQYVGSRNAASINRRWSRLLELRRKN